MGFTTPETFLIGYTVVDRPGLISYLKRKGLTSFLEVFDDAIKNGVNEGEALCSFYAKLCYKSLALGSNLNVEKVRDIPDNVKSIIKTGHGSVLEHVLVNFVTTNCSRVMCNELVRHRVGTAYCLAGDVEVWSGSKVNGYWNGVRKKWSMKELYERSSIPNQRSRIRMMMVRCLVKDKFSQARIKRITQSGIKPIFKMTLADGRSIRCSKDHLFLGENGWTPLHELKVGDYLVTNGRGVANDPIKEEDRKRKISSSKRGELNPGWRGDLIGESGAHFRARKLRKEICEECGSTYQLSVHHIDRNIFNNQEINLKTLCNPCHGKLHCKEDGNPNALLPEWMEIKSIFQDGEEMTYDLEIDHREHNFVANGIVTHNSQSSGRYIRSDHLDVIWDPILKPVEVISACEISSMEKTYQYKCDLMGLNGRAGIERALTINDPNKDSIHPTKEKIEEYIRINLPGIDPDKLDFTYKKQVTNALRYFLPNGLANEIGWSMNLRSARHIVQLRTSHHAAWEIRLVMNQVYDLMKERYPLIFHDAKERVVNGLREVYSMKSQPYEEEK